MPHTQTQRATNNSGFTLTEMLVVLVLIALLVALVAPNFLGRLGGARSQTAQTQLENLAGALDLYMIDTGGFPRTSDGLQVLVQAPIDASGWAGPYLHRGGVPTDPWGREFIYQSSAPGQYTLMTLGRDGETGGDGEDADLSVTTTVSTSGANN